MHIRANPPAPLPYPHKSTHRVKTYEQAFMYSKTPLLSSSPSSNKTHKTRRNTVIMGKAGQGSRSGRREHLAEDKFLKELEKMYAQGRVEGNGNVTVSISRMADKHIKAPKPTGAKKGKKEEPAPSGAVTKGSHAIVRGKRKGVSISCLVASDDILKFHVCQFLNPVEIKRARFSYRTFSQTFR